MGFESSDPLLQDFQGFSMSMVGSYVADADAMAELPDDTALFTTQQQIDFLAEAVNALDAEVIFTMALPRELTNDPSIPESISLEMRLVDGKGFINMDSLQFIDSSIPSGWHSTDLAMMIRTLALFANMDSAQTDMDTSNAEMMEALEAMDYNQFMSITRLPDDTVAGNSVAVFETTMNLGAMLHEPAFAAIFAEQFRAQMGPSARMMTDEQVLDAFVGECGCLDGWVINLTQSVGLSDFYTHQMTMYMELPMEIDESTTTITFDMVFMSSNFNNVAPIPEPPNATFHTLQEILEGLGDSGGF
jgi:hypothetical protein